MRILIKAEVKHITGLSDSTIHRMIKKGLFPQPIPRSDRGVGWLDEEIYEWILGRVKERDEKQKDKKDDL